MSGLFQYRRFGHYRTMTALPPMARIARLIGDPARALMLAALMDGRSRTAGELARAAAITAQTASAHLAKLVDGNLLAIEKQGRHRYHRLANAEVAHALEALLTLSASSLSVRQLGPADAALRRARVCYDHMAGEIAVQLSTHWLDQGWIIAEANEWRLTAPGETGLQQLGIALPDPQRRRPALRACLDWSERRCHLAGQLGMSVLQAMRVQDLVRQKAGSRLLMITAQGEATLARWLR